MIQPAEILTHIFSFLDTRSLLRANEVCRAWHGITEQKAFWDPQALQKYPPPKDGQTWKERFAFMCGASLHKPYSTTSESVDAKIKTIIFTGNHLFVGGNPATDLEHGWFTVDDIFQHLPINMTHQFNPARSHCSDIGYANIHNGNCEYVVFGDPELRCIYNSQGTPSSIFAPGEALSCAFITEEGVFIGTRKKTIYQFTFEGDHIETYTFTGKGVVLTGLYVDRSGIYGLSPVSVRWMDRHTKEVKVCRKQEQCLSRAYAAEGEEIFYLTTGGSLFHWQPRLSGQSSQIFSNIDSFRSISLFGDVLCVASDSTLYLFNHKTQATLHRIPFEDQLITAIGVWGDTGYVATHDKNEQSFALTTLSWKDK